MKTGKPSRKAWFALLAALLFAAAATAAAAQGPSVDNVLAVPVESSHIVEVSYDLACDTADSLFVQAYCSLDGGETWPILCRSATGDIGFDVETGDGKLFAWDAGADVPGILCETARVRVIAHDTLPAPYISRVWRSGLDKSQPQAFAKADTLSFSGNDTIAYGESFLVGWEGVAPVISALTPEAVAASDSVAPYDDGLLGFRYVLPGQDRWLPFAVDEATGDTIPVFGAENTLAFLNDGSGSDPLHAFLPSGTNLLQLNTIDILGTEAETAGRSFWFVVNYDPETIVLNGETDWAHPEDPEIYPYYVLMNDPLQAHHPFTAGDRIPDRSYVVCKALMRDDPRDRIVDPTFAGGLTGYARGVMERLNGALYSFQTMAAEADLEPAWPAGAGGWAADTLGFLVPPSTRVTMNLQAIDEHGRRDGTPAQLEFDVGYPPCVQCLEALPAGEASAFDGSVACYDPQAGSHPCFGAEAEFYVKSDGGAAQPGRTYLERLPEILFLAIDKQTHAVEVVADTMSLGATHYLIDANVYGMDILYHGRDDARESYDAVGQERWRTMAWRSQIDYDCDPYNEIRDGGGIDLLDSVLGGESGDGLLTIDGDGVWRNRVKFYAPRMLLDSGPEVYRIWLSVMFFWDGGAPDPEDPRVVELFELTTRQFGAGRVRAVALDQTECQFLPLRPAMYHLYHDMRPPADEPYRDTWRDCSPVVPVHGSIPLSSVAMPSLENEPVENFFRVVLQAGPDDGVDVECTGGGF